MLRYDSCWYESPPCDRIIYGTGLIKRRGTTTAGMNHYPAIGSKMSWLRALTNDSVPTGPGKRGKNQAALRPPSGARIRRAAARRLPLRCADGVPLLRADGLRSSPLCRRGALTPPSGARMRRAAARQRPRRCADGLRAALAMKAPEGLSTRTPCENTDPVFLLSAGRRPVLAWGSAQLVAVN